jgi:hypothetical protein
MSVEEYGFMETQGMAGVSTWPETFFSKFQGTSRLSPLAGRGRQTAVVVKVL